MRQVVYLIVLIAGMLVAFLYLKDITRVPDEVRSALGDSVKTRQQIGGTIRQRVGGDLEAHEKQIKEAVTEAEK